MNDRAMGVLRKCNELGQIVDIDGVITDAVCRLWFFYFYIDDTSAWRWWCFGGEGAVAFYALGF